MCNNAQYFQSKIAMGLNYTVKYVKDDSLRLQQQNISQLKFLILNFLGKVLSKASFLFF